VKLYLNTEGYKKKYTETRVLCTAISGTTSAVGPDYLYLTSNAGTAQFYGDFKKYQVTYSVSSRFHDYCKTYEDRAIIVMAPMLFIA
jgi:hypothetical protein